MLLGSSLKNKISTNLLSNSTQNLCSPNKISQTSCHTNSQKHLNLSKRNSTKKLSFRDSGNSLATTNLLNSINSSGRTKLVEIDTAPSLTQSKSGVLSSFGSKEKTSKIENKFLVKASKIIEENNEDCVPYSIRSFSKSEHDNSPNQ